MPDRLCDDVGSLCTGAQEAQEHARLQGCPLSTILLDRSFLRNYESHVDAFDVSKSVDSIDFFLSHSWSASGGWKQMALFICWCSNYTISITLVASVLGAWAFYRSRCNELMAIVLACGFIAFLVTVFIVPLLQHRKTVVFLDKCCIPQKDPVAKSSGIARLAEYLHASKKLIILWSPDYLDRLWCVYELAVFLQNHGEEDVILVNLDQLKRCTAMMLLQLLNVAVMLAVLPFSPYSPNVVYVLGTSTTLLVDYQALACGKVWQKCCARLKSFTIRRAKCSSSVDRSSLKRLIADMYGSSEKFEAVVRSLWLGKSENEHCPNWLFSGNVLRAMLALHIPLIVAKIATIPIIFRPTKEKESFLIPIYAQGVTPVLPAPMEVALWELRSSVTPFLMLCFRAPLMLVLGDRLANAPIFKRIGEWALMVVFGLCFVLYNNLTRLVCGYNSNFHLLRQGPIGSQTSEALIWLIVVIIVPLLFSSLRRSYSYKLPSTL